MRRIAKKCAAWPMTLLIVSFMLFSAAASWSDVISNYRATSFVAHDTQKKSFVVIRTFRINGRDHLLIVNPATLTTQVVAAKKLQKVVKAKPEQIFADSPYMRALARYTARPYVSTNYGLKSAQSAVDGVFLTVDMCPSTKTFEKQFFLDLIKHGTRKNPAPVAISVTGMWAHEHEQEFAWLMKQHRDHKLDITWINHSYHHHYPVSTPSDNKFSDEVFMVEKMLLAKRQVPSLFYRFPALSSDKNAVLVLRKLGLLPLGSDAWLAKKQKAKSGSIILVHGNGNEHIGILRAMHLLDDNLKLLPLMKAVFTDDDQ